MLKVKKMMTSSVVSDVISFFVTRNVKKSKIYSQPLNDLRKFNEIFRKDVT